MTGFPEPALGGHPPRPRTTWQQPGRWDRPTPKHLRAMVPLLPWSPAWSASGCRVHICSSAVFAEQMAPVPDGGTALSSFTCAGHGVAATAEGGRPVSVLRHLEAVPASGSPVLQCSRQRCERLWVLGPEVDSELAPQIPRGRIPGVPEKHKPPSPCPVTQHRPPQESQPRAAPHLLLFVHRHHGNPAFPTPLHPSCSPHPEGFGPHPIPAVIQCHLLCRGGGSLAGPFTPKPTPPAASCAPASA